MNQKHAATTQSRCTQRLNSTCWKSKAKSSWAVSSNRRIEGLTDGKGKPYRDPNLVPNLTLVLDHYT